MFTAEPSVRLRVTAPPLDPAPALEPEVSAGERLLVCPFPAPLCHVVRSQKRRFAQMQGAAALHRSGPEVPG
jgi:hypothetical protein